MGIALDKERRWWVLGAAALIIALMAIAYKFARPALPAEVIMSTGGSGGAYEAFGKKYAAALAEEGVTLTLKPSNGAVENLARLSDERSGVDVALIQSGIADREKMEVSALVSLGSMFFEPLWVFYRPASFAQPVSSLAQLAGKRIAVGAQGSGTRVLVGDVLALHAITTQNATLAELGAQASLDQLRAGAVDAVFLVGAVSAPLVQSAFRDATLRVADLALAETYARLKPALSMVTLPAGVIDLPAMIPAAPVRTVAAASSLIIRDDLHPAVIFLLMRAAKKLHNPGGALSKNNEFPSLALQQDFPVAPEAERFAKEGVPFLYRYLPFKVANFVSRAVVFLLPLIALLLPLTDWLPKLYGMRVKSRLFSHYKEMKRIDQRVRDASTHEALDNAERELDALDAAVGQMAIPNGYSNDQFGIRDDIDLVRTRVQRRREGLSG
ncbi:MAG: TAXI family TRAP transporter solute-binding subunit [Burkholderiales bacterium]|nr:TAXI family TRAP transporter solute-binding subunit [Burkholderiales bacterium]